MPEPTLPNGILQEDLKSPGSLLLTDSFELYYTNRFGWCIATLEIAKAKRNYATRTYGISIKDHQTVSMGNGPHVLAHHVVVVHDQNRARLKTYLDLRAEGMKKSQECRDFRSTARSVRSTYGRNMGGLFGPWDS
jgi:hypothetical protein